MHKYLHIVGGYSVETGGADEVFTRWLTVSVPMTAATLLARGCAYRKLPVGKLLDGYVAYQPSVQECVFKGSKA